MGLDRIENNDSLDGAKAAMDAIVTALLKGPVAQPVEDDTDSRINRLRGTGS